MSSTDWAEFSRGIEQFNRGEFFAAHETWESIWLAASGQDRMFLQGIIQLAAAFHHGSGGNAQGALSLSRRALEKLANFADCFRGVRVDRLRAQAGRWEKIWADGSAGAPVALPKIEMESTPRPDGDS